MSRVTFDIEEVQAAFTKLALNGIFPLPPSPFETPFYDRERAANITATGRAELEEKLAALRDDPSAFLKFAGCYTYGDFMPLRDPWSDLADAILRTPPREKPSHKLTTFERMRQSEAARRSRIKRLLK